MIFDRLEQMEQRYNEMQAQFALPEVLNDHERYQKIAKSLREIETPVEKYRELKQVRQGLADARQMLATATPSCAPWPRRRLPRSSRAPQPSKKSSRCCCCPKIPTTRRT